MHPKCNENSRGSFSDHSKSLCYLSELTSINKTIELLQMVIFRFLSNAIYEIKCLRKCKNWILTFVQYIKLKNLEWTFDGTFKRIWSGLKKIFDETTYHNSVNRYLGPCIFKNCFSKGINIKFWSENILLFLHLSKVVYLTFF